MGGAVGRMAGILTPLRPPGAGANLRRQARRVDDTSASLRHCGSVASMAPPCLEACPLNAACAAGRADRQLDRVEAGHARRRDRAAPPVHPAKIVVGPREIERYGDSTLGEVLKRCQTPDDARRARSPAGDPHARPGQRLRRSCSTASACRRGSRSTSMDGPGRAHEILRAQWPGVWRARSPARQHHHSRGATASSTTTSRSARRGNDEVTPGFSWSRSDTAGDLTLQRLSASGAVQRRDSTTDILTVDQTADDGVVTLGQGPADPHARGTSAPSNLNARLQWQRRRVGVLDAVRCGEDV